MPIARLHRLLLLTLLSFSLGACGFALRGTADLPAALHEMQVVSLEPNGELVLAVRRALQDNGVTPGDTSAYRLGLGREERSERPLSVNANARAGEYELTMSVLFQLTHAGDAVIKPQTLTVQRSYLADPDNAVAKAEEAEVIRQEMRQDLAQQILRRLQSLRL